MTTALPPLNSLRAFEAAARHLSFKKAAEELRVTPAAVGHQVKGLEAILGLQLFRRLNRGLVLTDAGQAALPALKRGFESLAEAAEILRRGDSRNVLTATVAPSFAAKWLIPRLERFRAACPEISVRLDTDLAELDLLHEGLDLGIRFGSGHYPGLAVTRLMTEELFPVCSPSLLPKRKAARSVAALKDMTLLHIEGETVDPTWPDWPRWLKAAGAEGIDASAGPRFSQSMMAVQAAIEGQGVALAPRSIVADDLAAGRLLRPFAEREATRTAFAFYLVSPVERAVLPKVVAFREWILAEAQSSS